MTVDKIITAGATMAGHEDCVIDSLMRVSLGTKAKEGGIEAIARRVIAVISLAWLREKAWVWEVFALEDEGEIDFRRVRSRIVRIRM